MIYKSKQEELRAIIEKNNIKYSWIAEQLGTYYQKIEYAVETAKDTPDDLYKAMMFLFEKHGYSANSTELCTNLISSSFLLNAKFGTEIKRINDEIASDIQDGKFSPDERLRFRFKLEDIRREFNEQIDSLLKLTQGEVKQ